MDTKIAARLLGIALVAQVSTAATSVQGREDSEPVTVGPGVSVFEADREHVRLVRWAAERFETGGLEVPAVQVHFHPDTSGCYGHLGSQLGRRVDVCVMSVFELGRETLLHEMGHAWIDQNVAQTVRERFTEMRGLRAWNQSTVPWDDRAYEHGAEIIAWGLGNRYMVPSIPDRDPARLAAGFEFLTGVPVPNPSET
jgi:hypothetical protein